MHCNINFITNLNQLGIKNSLVLQLSTITINDFIAQNVVESPGYKHIIDNLQTVPLLWMSGLSSMYDHLFVDSFNICWDILCSNH